MQVKKCSVSGCNAIGNKTPLPKKKNRLQRYRWLCKPHAKELLETEAHNNKFLAETRNYLTR